MRLLALLLAGSAGAAGSLAAQVTGLPVRNAGIGTGFGVAADIGFPNGAMGKGTGYGATGVIGLGPLGLSASVARWNPGGDADAVTSVGGTGNLKVFGGPLVPLTVTLQGGFGRARTNEVTTLRFPVGLGVALTIPNPAFSIKPWLAPRVDVSRQSGTGIISGTDTRFGISGGVDLGFLSGLSVRVMYDRISAGGGANPAVLSLGVGFRVGT